ILGGHRPLAVIVRRAGRAEDGRACAVDPGALHGGAGADRLVACDEGASNEHRRDDDDEAGAGASAARGRWDGTRPPIPGHQMRLPLRRYAMSSLWCSLTPKGGIMQPCTARRNMTIQNVARACSLCARGKRLSSRLA